jgi:hypothetical protein
VTAAATSTALIPRRWRVANARRVVGPRGERSATARARRPFLPGLARSRSPRARRRGEVVVPEMAREQLARRPQLGA